MRQFDTQVNEFMDSLIEESASLGSSHVSTVFQSLSDKEKSKLRYWNHAQTELQWVPWLASTLHCSHLLSFNCKSAWNHCIACSCYISTSVLLSHIFFTFSFLFYTCRHTQPSQGPSKQFVIRRSLLEWVMSVFSLRSCTDIHVIWDLFLSCFQDMAFIWLADLNKPVYYITIYEM